MICSYLCPGHRLEGLAAHLGGHSAGGSSTPPASTSPSESEAPPAETESAPEEEMSSLDILLSMEDQLPLGGLQPAYLESREDINKALPMTKTNDDDITIGWASVSLASTYFTELYDSVVEKCEE